MENQAFDGKCDRNRDGMPAQSRSATKIRAAGIVLVTMMGLLLTTGCGGAVITPPLEEVPTILADAGPQLSMVSGSMGPGAGFR